MTFTRRDMLERSGQGFGAMALAALLADDAHVFITFPIPRPHGWFNCSWRVEPVRLICSITSPS